MTTALIEFLVYFVVEIALLHVFFVWIDRRWPPRPWVDVSGLDAATRARMAKRANRFGTLVAALSCLILIGLWSYGFYRLQVAMVPAIPNTLFVRMPTPVMHGFVAIFAGIALAGPVGLGLMRLLYLGRYHEVMAVGDAHYRYDARRWLYLTFVWVVPLCVDAESLWLGRFVLFTSDGIHSRTILSRRATYHAYRDVVAIYGIDGMKKVNQQLLPDQRFSIEFRDGEGIPYPRFAYHDGRPEDFAPIRIAEARSGVPIQWVQEFE